MAKQNHLSGYGWFLITAEGFGEPIRKVVRVRGRQDRVKKFKSLCSRKELSRLEGEACYTAKQLKPGDEGFGIEN